MDYRKEFIVAAKSSNTNSFGLFQMIMVAKCGETYKTHASMYNAKDVGSKVNMKIRTNDEGKVMESYFVGHEMTSRMNQAPKEVINELPWN